MSLYRGLSAFRDGASFRSMEIPERVWSLPYRRPFRWIFLVFLFPLPLVGCGSLSLSVQMLLLFCPFCPFSFLILSPLEFKMGGRGTPQMDCAARRGWNLRTGRGLLGPICCSFSLTPPGKLCGAEMQLVLAFEDLTSSMGTDM